MRNRIKQVSALVLAIALMCSGAALPDVYAAIHVDTEAACSVVIDPTATSFRHLNGKWSDEEKSAAAIKDFKTYAVTVDLYKVADITIEGKYIAISELRDLKVGESGVTFQTLLNELGEKTDANDWDTIMNFAKARVDAKLLAKTASKTMTASVMTIDETITGKKLGTGLYLVDVPTVQTAYYEYKFASGLVSLPNNYFYSVNKDDWIYTNVAVNIKPERAERYGDLKIVKNLDAYNAAIDGATFVFRVEAVKTDVDTNEAKPVYSNVLAVDFNAPGQKDIVVEEIPAGAEVTVTEIYTGASYKLTSDAAENTVIIAEGEEGAPAAVNFANTYDYRLNGGNGVVNSFTYTRDASGNITWSHSAMNDFAEIQPREQR